MHTTRRTALLATAAIERQLYVHGSAYGTATPLHSIEWSSYANGYDVMAAAGRRPCVNVYAMMTALRSVQYASFAQGVRMYLASSLRLSILCMNNYEDGCAPPVQYVDFLEQTTKRLNNLKVLLDDTLSTIGGLVLLRPRHVSEADVCCDIIRHLASHVKYRV